eukprot:scaffold58480_cov27-Tisochrysis_lutea.AAC.2
MTPLPSSIKVVSGWPLEGGRGRKGEAGGGSPARADKAGKDQKPVARGRQRSECQYGLHAAGAQLQHTVCAGWHPTRHTDLGHQRPRPNPNRLSRPPKLKRRAQQVVKKRVSGRPTVVPTGPAWRHGGGRMSCVHGI